MSTASLSHVQTWWLRALWTLHGIGLVAPGVFVFILPVAHTVAVRLTCLGFALLSAGYAWLHDRPPRPPRHLLFALALWAGIATLTLLWTLDYEYSIGELRNEVGYAMATFFTAYALTRDENDLRRWLRFISASAVVIGTYGITAWLWHRQWYTAGWIGDRNLYSTYVVLVLPMLALCWHQASDRPAWRYIAAAAIGITLVGGAMTFNRTVWAAVLGAASVSLLLMWRRQMLSRRMLASAAILFVALAMGSAAVWIAATEARTGLNITGVKGMVAGVQQDPRTGLWRYAAGRIAERPWTGHGFGRGILGKDFHERFKHELHGHGHNVFLNYAIEGGIPLAVALALVFVALGWSLYRYCSDEDRLTQTLGVVGLAMVAGVLVKTSTDDVLLRDTALFFWFAMGAIIGVGERRRWAARHHGRRAEIR